MYLYPVRLTKGTIFFKSLSRGAAMHTRHCTESASPPTVETVAKFLTLFLLKKAKAESL